MSEGRSNGVDRCDWISPRAGLKRSAGLGASGLFFFVSFEMLRVVRNWIPSTLFPLSPAELDGARKRVDGEPPRRGDEPGAHWAGEEQTAYLRLFYAYD